MLPELIETSSALSAAAKASMQALVARVDSQSPPAPLSDQASALVAQAAASASADRTPDAIFALASDPDGQLCGFGVADLRLDPPVAEFAVDTSLDDPTTWAQALFDDLAQNYLARSDGTENLALTLWDHGAETAIGQLAQARAWPARRSLVIMGSQLAGTKELPPLADSWQLRPFAPATDETGWLALNRAAFADLPDQGSWTPADLRARYSEPWFDPAGFLVLVDQNDTIVGAHWTKQVGEVGEVYVLAVAPELAGSGLGALLTQAGLNHLHATGATSVQLYVDANNTAALQLYRKVGFTELARDTLYLAGLGHA